MLKTRWPWLLIATALLLAFCAWAAVRIRSSDWYVAETKYARIKVGMARQEVADILGPADLEIEMGARRGRYSPPGSYWRIGHYNIGVEWTHPSGSVKEMWLTRPDTSWERLRAWLAF